MTARCAADTALRAARTTATSAWVTAALIGPVTVETIAFFVMCCSCSDAANATGEVRLRSAVMAHPFAVDLVLPPPRPSPFDSPIAACREGAAVAGADDREVPALWHEGPWCIVRQDPPQ